MTRRSTATVTGSPGRSGSWSVPSSISTPRWHRAAADLGKAMQLTNICRDVLADAEPGVGICLPPCARTACRHRARGGRGCRSGRRYSRVGCASAGAGRWALCLGSRRIARLAAAAAAGRGGGLADVCRDRDSCARGTATRCRGASTCPPQEGRACLGGHARDAMARAMRAQPGGQMPRPDVDIAILGGGCAGLSVAVRLAAAGRSLRVIEPREAYVEDRAWSFWRTSRDPFEDCVRRSWSELGYPGAGRTSVRRNSNRLRYQTVGAGAFYDRAQALIGDHRRRRCRSAPPLTPRAPPRAGGSTPMPVR